MTLPRVPENLLVHVVRVGVVLLLLTPFVVSPRTIFPFVVGKALYSRSLIEIVFVSWALLALFKPSWRPPRSRILILLAIALGVAVLSASLGISAERSFWSNYERMQGVVDQAHWFALAVVLVSVLRTGRDWRVLLTLHLAAGVAMALMAVAEYHGGHRGYAPDSTRAMSTLGNPIFLGTYLGVNVMIALGFLVRSFVPAARPGKASAPAGEEPGKRADRRNPPRRIRNARLVMPWAGRCFWGAAAFTGLWAIALTGSRGPVLGFVSGLAFPAVLFVSLARARTVRFVAAGAAGLLGIAAVLLLVLSFSPAPSPTDTHTRNANPLTSRLTAHDSLVSVRQRLFAWEAGVKGFLDRPVTGWGPENFIAIWGRHGAGSVLVPEVYDYSHNKLIEELATKGLFGLLSHVAIWGFAFHIVLCAARNRDPRERVPVLFAGAALTGYFVQSMTTIDSAAGSLQLALLLALVARLETVGNRPAAAAEQGGRARRSASSIAGGLADLARWQGARPSLAAGTILLAVAALSTNQAIYSSARAAKSAFIGSTNPADAPPGRTRIQFERAIDGFEPLANYPRRILFQYAAGRWKHLHARDRAEAKQLLAMVDAEARAAVESEPGNWRMYTALAGFYSAVAVTDSTYRGVAKRYLDTAFERAPGLLLGTPDRPH